jgi:hypothetical protein
MSTPTPPCGYATHRKEKTAEKEKVMDKANQSPEADLVVPTWDLIKNRMRGNKGGRDGLRANNNRGSTWTRCGRLVMNVRLI